MTARPLPRFPLVALHVASAPCFGGAVSGGLSEFRERHVYLQQYSQTRRAFVLSSAFAAHIASNASRLRLRAKSDSSLQSASLRRRLLVKSPNIR